MRRWSPPHLQPLEDRTAPAGLFAVATAAGSAPIVQVYDSSTLQLRMQILAYDAGFLGGVSVAVGDITGDGIDDIITGAGPGAGPHVKVFDGTNGELIGSFFAFDAGFRGGVNVAAGQFDADAALEIVAGAGPGAGPNVRVFDLTGGTGVQLAGPLGSFFAYDPSFTGGVHVAAGRFSVPVLDDVITAPADSANPHVRAFQADGTIAASFFAYDPGATNGLTVAAGDVTGDGLAEIITGPNVGAVPEVRIFASGSAALLSSFLAYPASSVPSSPLGPSKADLLASSDTRLPGAHVGTTIVGTGPARILTGAGVGSNVRIFNGATNELLDSFFAFDPTYRGGVFVSGR